MGIFSRREKVKRAVLIGCQYPGTEDELLGCTNDVNMLADMLEEVYGFDPDNITFLVDYDTGKNAFTKATGANIRV